MLKPHMLECLGEEKKGRHQRHRQERIKTRNMGMTMARKPYKRRTDERDVYECILYKWLNSKIAEEDPKEVASLKGFAHNVISSAPATECILTRFSDKKWLIGRSQ